MDIAAICAFPPKHNTGMLSVDMALYSLYKRRLEKSGINLHLLSAESDYSVGSGESVKLTFKRVKTASELAKFDRVLIWGDFLQSRHYQISGLKNRARKQYGENYRAKHREWIDVLRLNGFPEENLDRLICTGGTIYTNEIEDESDVAYFLPLKKLLSKAKLVQMRDVVSSALAQSYSDRIDHTHGCDCAFFLRPFDSFKFSSESVSSTDKVLGYSFGRTIRTSDDASDKFSDFVSRLQSATKSSDAVNINWLSSRESDPIAGLRKKIDSIKRCSVIVTDTYHCAINAWREGVPAICIGRGAEKTQGTLADKKKELLYAALKIRKFYVYYESLNEIVDRELVVEEIASVLQNKEYIESVNRSIFDQTKRIEDRLVNNILY